jgi:hypothetical protein
LADLVRELFYLTQASQGLFELSEGLGYVVRQEIENLKDGTWARVEDLARDLVKRDYRFNYLSLSAKELVTTGNVAPSTEDLIRGIDFTTLLGDTDASGNQQQQPVG